MSVDFHTCDSCGRTFCAYNGQSTYCNDNCGFRWCCGECADEDGYIETEIDSDGNREASCSYCRNEAFTDHELLNFLLDEHEISREELVEEYKKTL